MIEAKPDVRSTIVVVNADSKVGADLRPLPRYKALDPGQIEFGDPLVRYGYGADLDAMNVGEFVVGSKLDSDDADLWSA